MNKHSILYKYKIIQDLIDITSTKNSNILNSNFDDVYNKHLIQKIMQIGSSEFLNDKNFNTLIRENKVRTKNFKISSDKGFESISIVLFFKSLFVFFVLWLLLFFYYFFALINFNQCKKIPRNKIIIFGVEHLNFNNNEIKNNFISFIKKHITISSGDDILVSSNIYKSSILKNFIFKKYPHTIILNSGLRFKDFLKIQSLHLRYLLIFLLNTLRDSRSSILAKDFAMMSLFDFSNSKKMIKSIIFTNTNINYQPLWSSNYIDRKFSTSMFWYSENASPVVRDVNNNKQYFNQYHPHISLLSVDNHYVWTKFFANTLKKFTSTKKLYVIGPILWKNIKKNTKPIVIEKNILIFDVTALTDEWKKMSGYCDVFYSYKNMKLFISDIIECKNSIKSLSDYKLILKPKRKALPQNDSKYINYLKMLESENKITIIDSNTDIDIAIKNSSFIICIPFTSPLILADYLNKNSIYYDPTDSIIPYDAQGNLLIKGKKSLYKELLKINKRDIC